MIDNANFPNLNYLHDLMDIIDHQCLTANVNFTDKTLDLITAECISKMQIVCRKILFVRPNCSIVSRFTNHNMLAIVLDPTLKHQYQQAIAYKKIVLIDKIQRINLQEVYKSFYELLWYSSIPCFQIRNLTAGDNDYAILRYCEWKGIPISCSAIFTSFPTDQGMCCSFNMKAADDIYTETTFRDMLHNIQSSDKISSFLNSKIPIAYEKGIEPKTISGTNKGLVLFLDAHSNEMSPGSQEGGFNRFTAVIGSSGSFPLMNQEGFPIRPGVNFINILLAPFCEKVLCSGFL